MQTTIFYSIESISFAPLIYVTKNRTPIQLRYLTGGHQKKTEVQTTILYSIESISFSFSKVSINVTKNSAPTFLCTLPGDIEKIYNEIVCKSEGWAFFLKWKLIIKCYRMDRILLSAPSFFNRLPSGHRKKPVQIFWIRGLGFCFDKLKSYIICY